MNLAPVGILFAYWLKSTTCLVCPEAPLLVMVRISVKVFGSFTSVMTPTLSLQLAEYCLTKSSRVTSVNEVPSTKNSGIAKRPSPSSLREALPSWA